MRDSGRQKVDYRKRIDGLNDSVSSNDAEIVSLKAELAESVRSHNDQVGLLNAKLADSDAEIDSLNAKLADSDAEIGSLT